MVLSPLPRIRVSFTVIRCSILAALLLNAAPIAAGGLKPYVGDPVPTAGQLRDMRGQLHSISDHKGKVVLVNFWASWCAPCITEIPSLRELHRQLAGSAFGILAINVEEGPFKIHRFSQLVEMPFPILLDEDGLAFDAWGGVVLPTSFLVDPEGRIRFWVQGPLDWASEDAVETVRSLLPDAEPE